jgi:hypothetical protein
MSCERTGNPLLPVIRHRKEVTKLGAFKKAGTSRLNSVSIWTNGVWRVQWVVTGGAPKADGAPVTTGILKLKLEQ